MAIFPVSKPQGIDSCFIAPDGRWFNVPRLSHGNFALSGEHGEQASKVSQLERLGWLHFSCGVLPSGHENVTPTQAQIDTIYEWIRALRASGHGCLHYTEDQLEILLANGE